MTRWLKRQIGRVRSRARDRWRTEHPYWRLVRLTVELPFVLPIDDGVLLGRRGGSREFNFGVELVASLTGDPDEDNSVVFAPHGGSIGPVGEGVEVPGLGDRHTRVFVEFAYDGQGPEMSEAEEAHSKQRAIGYLNHALNCFRTTVATDTVRPLSEVEVYTPRFGIAARWWTKTWSGQGMGVTFGNRPVELRHTPNLQPAEQAAFAERLRSGVAVPLPTTMLADAEHHFRQRDFRRAVADASTALDILVEDAVRRMYLRTPGRLTAEINAKLDRHTTIRIAEVDLRALRGHDVFKMEPAWAEWREKAWPARNKVIHDGLEPAEWKCRETLDLVRKLADHVATY